MQRPYLMSKVLHRSFKKTLPIVMRADGNYIFDQTGKKYLDACGGAAVSCLGHTNKNVINAIKNQMDKVAFAHTGFFTNEPSEELAARLMNKTPEGFGAGRAMFLGSGSEAMEAALKLARQFHSELGNNNKTKVISRISSYHGNTLGALATGGHKGRRAPYQSMLMEVTYIPPCYAYRLQEVGETEEEFGLRMADYLENEVLALGPENVAAFVAEPVSGATLGCVPPVKGYFKRIRQICDQYNILFIADEVMCGSGRTGTFFAIETENVAPDIITCAKGLGAGYQPIAAVLINEKLAKTIESGSGNLWNGHTYMNHAVACAGANAVLKTMDDENLLHNVNVQGAKLEKLLKKEFENHPNIGDIRGRGLFWSMEIVENKKNKTAFPSEKNIAPIIKDTAFEKGLLCYPAQGCVDGKNGDHVLLAPPYTVSDEELNFIIETLKETLNDVLTLINRAA